MTGIEFKSYLVDSGMFYEHIPAYLIDSTCNRIPAHIRMGVNYLGQPLGGDIVLFDIELRYNGGIDVRLHTRDRLHDDNPIVCYKLNEMTILDLIREMDKFIDLLQSDRCIGYRYWRTKLIADNRDNIISTICG